MRPHEISASNPQAAASTTRKSEVAARAARERTEAPTRAQYNRELRKLGATWAEIAANYLERSPDIGPRKAHRWALDLTQQDVARKIDESDKGHPTASEARIADFERGKPTGRTPTILHLEQLAQAYATTASALLTTDELASFTDAGDRFAIEQIDYRHLDPNHLRKAPGASPAEPAQRPATAPANGALRFADAFTTPLTAARPEPPITRPPGRRRTVQLKSPPLPLPLGTRRETEHDAKDPNVQRRTLIALVVAALGAGRAVDHSLLSQLLAGSSLANGPTAPTDHWQELALEYGQTYLLQPREQTIRELAIELATLGSISPQLPDSPRVHASLSESGALLAALMAMACTDLGLAMQARHSWLLARHLSDRTGSGDVRSWVRGQEALLGLYSARPLSKIQMLAIEGIQQAGNQANAGLAELLSAHSQAFALQGQPQKALTALTQLEDVFNRLPSSVKNARDSVYGWPEHRLRHVESYVHSMIGLPHRAAEAQNAALALYPSTRAISRAQIQMHRALSLVRAGDIDIGIRHAVEQLDSLSPRHRGHFVLTLARQIVLAAPEKHTTHPALNDFRDYLSTIENPAN